MIFFCIVPAYLRIFQALFYSLRKLLQLVENNFNALILVVVFVIIRKTLQTRSIFINTFKFSIFILVLLQKFKFFVINSVNFGQKQICYKFLLFVIVVKSLFPLEYMAFELDFGKLLLAHDIENIFNIVHVVHTVKS